MATPINPNVWYEMEATNSDGYSIDLQLVNRQGIVIWKKTVALPRRIRQIQWIDLADVDAVVQASVAEK